MNLGETIYRLRTEKNMSQGDLADALGVSRQSVSKWENGNAIPDLDKLVTLSKLFGVTLDELVGNSQKSETSAALTAADSAKSTVVYLEKTVLPAISRHHIIGAVLILCSLIYGLVLNNEGYHLVEILLLASPFSVCGILFLCTHNFLLSSGWILAGAYWCHFLIIFHRWENHPFLILLGVAVVIVMILLTVREHCCQRIHIPFWLWVAGGILLAALFILLCINCIPSIAVSAAEHPAVPIVE